MLILHIVTLLLAAFCALMLSRNGWKPGGEKAAPAPMRQAAEEPSGAFRQAAEEPSDEDRRLAEEKFAQGVLGVLGYDGPGGGTRR